MKKVYLVIAVFILSISSIFAVDTSISFGVQDRVTDFNIHSPMYVTIDIWQYIGNFKAYGEYTNELTTSDDSWTFSPTQDFFTVGVSYDFDIFLVRLEHQCSHPVKNYAEADSKLYSSYTKFEITIGD